MAVANELWLCVVANNIQVQRKGCAGFCIRSNIARTIIVEIRKVFRPYKLIRKATLIITPAVENLRLRYVFDLLYFYNF